MDLTTSDRHTQKLLAEQVARYADEGTADYIVAMWRYLLEDHCAQGPAKATSERCDALPYLPFDPKTYGVDLCADEVLLDVGCLGGYGLYDIYRRRRLSGTPVPRMIGTDIRDESLAVASTLASIWATDCDVAFHKSRVEDMPASLGPVSLAMARLVLPYTDVKAALRALSGVLATGGVLFLQLHAPRYYLAQLVRSLPRVRPSFYYLRPLLTWAFLSLTGWQPQGALLRETALTPRLVTRLCHGYGLSRCSVFGFTAKPMLVYRKRP